MNIYGEIIDSKCYRDNPVVIFPLQVEHQHNLTLGVFKCFLIDTPVNFYFLPFYNLFQKCILFQVFHVSHNSPPYLSYFFL